jgi:hypothetical protein
MRQELIEFLETNGNDFGKVLQKSEELYENWKKVVTRGLKRIYL